MPHLIKPLILSICSSLILIACGSGENTNSISNNDVTSDDIEVFDRPMPYSTELYTPKITTIASVSKGTVSLVWQPSLSSNEELDRTVQYNIHASTKPNFEPKSNNVVMEKVEDKRLVIDGFEPNKTYYLRVTVNKGKDNTMSEAQRVVISDDDLSLVKNADVVVTDEIDTDLENMTNSQIQISDNDNLIQGSIIVDPKTGEAVKVTSIDDKNIATVAKVNLADIFDQAHIKIDTRLDNWE